MRKKHIFKVNYDFIVDFFPILSNEYIILVGGVLDVEVVIGFFSNWIRINNSPKVDM